MKRFAWLLLALVLAFVGSAFVDHCADEGADAGCPPLCHVSCADGCAVAPIDAVTPMMVALARVGDAPGETVAPLRELVIPPELAPPRARA